MGTSHPFLEIIDFKTKSMRRLKHIHKELKASYEKQEFKKLT
jgi:hypothetical protein